MEMTLSVLRQLDDLWENQIFNPLVTFPSIRNEMIPKIRLDMKETENSYEIIADLPGVNRDNIKISIEESHLYISAERNDNKEMRNGEHYFYTERCLGSTSRYVELPIDADSSSIKAKYENGVLYISIVKKSESRRRYINID